MSSVIEKYEQWVKSNAFWLTPLEDSLRAMTIFIPGRFSNAEMRGEAVYTALNLLSIYHDRILDRHRVLTADIKCDRKTQATRVAQGVITFLKNTQVLIEMLAVRRFPAQTSVGGLPGKWLIVFAVEAVKAACCLLILKHNGGTLLVTQTPEETLAAIHKKRMLLLLEQWQEKHEDLSTPGVEFADVKRLYLLHGRAGGEAHGQFSPYTNAEHLASLTHSNEPGLAHTTYFIALAELLNIARPVIYVLGRLMSKGDASWNPLLMSIAVDVVSRALLQRYTRQMSSEQKAELNRRVAKWFFYLLRPPLFELVTRSPLVRLGKLFSRLPLIGSLFENVVEMIMWLPSSYFYTSAT